jgi:hypothetical protein
MARAFPRPNPAPALDNSAAKANDKKVRISQSGYGNTDCSTCLVVGSKRDQQHPAKYDGQDGGRPQPERNRGTGLMLDIKLRFGFQPPANHPGARVRDRLATVFGKQ